MLSGVPDGTTQMVLLLNQREVPACKGGDVSKVWRSRTSPARKQLRATPVKAWESTLLAWLLPTHSVLARFSLLGERVRAIPLL
jgi:hypothetical protein